MKIEIRTKEELFDKVYRVLTIRKKELAKEDIDVSEEILWAFFSSEVFMKMQDLTLADVVSKILKVESSMIKSYLVKNEFL